MQQGSASSRVSDTVSNGLAEPLSGDTILADAVMSIDATMPSVSGSSERLRLPTGSDNVAPVTEPSQRDRRTMSRRRGQRGTVNVVGTNYVGRFWTDVAGSTKRARKAVKISSTEQMTKPEAERWLAKFIGEQGINDMEHLEHSRRPVVTFGIAAAAWKNHLVATKKPSSRRSMICELKKHVLPLLKAIPMDELNYPTIRGLITAWRNKGLSTKSVSNLFAIVRAVYNFHVDEVAQGGRTLLQPWGIKWKKIKPITDIEKEVPCFEEEQMVAIVNKAESQRDKALYALAGGAGVRASELFALRCEDVNLAVGDGTGVVTIRRGVFEGKEYTTKSNKVRHVPIDTTVVAQLKRHLEGRRHGYVFQTRNGTPLRESNVLPELHDVLKALGMPPAGFHAFRHGRCSFLVRSDVARAVIREWLGHGSDAMIDSYSHRLGKYGAREMQKLTPLLDSTWTQGREKQSGAALQVVVN